jgi:hypothetical protein
VSISRTTPKVRRIDIRKKRKWKSSNQLYILFYISCFLSGRHQQAAIGNFTQDGETHKGAQQQLCWAGMVL